MSGKLHLICMKTDFHAKIKCNLNPENDPGTLIRRIDTLDLQWQKLTDLAPSKTRQVSDVGVSYYPYIRFHMWPTKT